MLAVAPVGKPDEVQFLQTFEVASSGLVRKPFVLHGALITGDRPAYHHRASGMLTQIDGFARGLDGVEHDLEVVGHDEADDSSLRSTKR